MSALKTISNRALQHLRPHLPAILAITIVYSILFALWFGAQALFFNPTLRYEGLDKFVLWAIAGCYLVAFPLWITMTSIAIVRDVIFGSDR